MNPELLTLIQKHQIKNLLKMNLMKNNFDTGNKLLVIGLIISAILIIAINVLVNFF